MYIWSNEAWFASPAVTLLHNGYLGTTILESKGTWMEGLDRRTYWLPPVHLLVQAAWYRVVGFSLGALRSLSIVAGVAVLLAWCAIVVRLTGDRSLALLAMGITLLDPRFLTFGVLGRADMLCAAFGSAGLAAYLALRERSLPAALIAGHALAAAACLTHPCGVLYAVGLIVMMAYCDRSRIAPALLWRVALPYAVGLAAWGLYIAQAPAEFVRQFTGNISGIAGEFTAATRWSGLASPIAALWREYALRYAATSGWYETTLAGRLMLFSLAVYTVAAVGCIATGALRRHTGVRVLLLIGAVDYLVMALFDGLKGSAYLVHTLPLAAALTAVFVRHAALRSRRIARWSIGGVAVAFIAAQAATTFLYLYDQPARRDYERVVAFLKPPAGQLIAPGEFAFALGFESGMIDDFRLGYFSGKRPRFIVTNSIYRGWLRRSASTHPEIHAYMTRLLRDEYRVALSTRRYTVHERVVN